MTSVLDHDLPQGVDAEALIAALTDAGVLTDDAPMSLRAQPIGNGLVARTLQVAATPEGGGPVRSVVVKMEAPDQASRDTGFGRLLYDREVGFYRELADTLSVRTPRSSHASIDRDAQRFALVLEDLSPARTIDQLDGCSPEQAETAVAQAAALHAPRWGDATLEQLPWLHFGEQYNAQLQAVAQGGYAAFRDRFAAHVAPEVLDFGERLMPLLGAYFARHGRPWTVQHGDFRLDNMLWNARGGSDDLVVVDWQTVLLGPGALDVAYFLGSSLTTDDRRAHEERLVRGYHQALIAAGVENYSWDQCWEHYRLHSVAGFALTVAVATALPPTERSTHLFAAMANRHGAHCIDAGVASLLG